MKRLLILFVLVLPAVFIRIAIGESESFLVISDAHLTKETQEHDAMQKAIIQAAQGKDAVLLLGDNTNNAHAEEHSLVLQWVSEIKQLTGAEILIIPGNHDYTTHFGPDEFCVQYRSFGWGQAFSRDTATASYAVMTQKGTCLLMLDTNHFDHRYTPLPYGGIWENTLNWIQEVLTELPDGTPVLACGHHPILPRERNELTPGSSALNEILRAYGVNLYLCGHEHGFSTTEQDGFRQMIVGKSQDYPGWAGMVEQENGQFVWHTEQIYDEQSPVFRRLKENAYSLGRQMALGTLSATQYADDENAVEWFVSAFMLLESGDLTPDKSARLLADENCQKWRLVETRTVVKNWILNMLENTPDDVRNISVPSSQKHTMELPDSSFEKR